MRQVYSSQYGGRVTEGDSGLGLCDTPFGRSVLSGLRERHSRFGVLRARQRARWVAASVAEGVSTTEGSEGGAAAEAVPVSASAEDKPKRRKVPLSHMVSGGIAGAVSRTITAPLDRLKVLYEVEHHGKAKRHIWRDLKAIRNRGGWSAYFRGNGANVIKIMPKMALKFYVFEFIKSKLVSDPDDMTMAIRLVSGMIAAGVSQATIHPLDCIKTRLAASDPDLYKGIFDCATKMWKEEGYRAFYRGVTVSTLGIIPSMGVDLMVYDTLRSYTRKWYGLSEKETPPAHMLLLVGSISTACGYGVGHPFGLVRSRLMVSGMKSEFKQRYSGNALDVLLRTIRDDGIRGLYRGLIPQLLRVLPAGSITYVVYDKLQGLFQRKRDAY